MVINVIDNLQTIENHFLPVWCFEKIDFALIENLVLILVRNPGAAVKMMKNYIFFVRADKCSELF